VPVPSDVDILVIGAGHAGLGVAARLKERSREALVVEAHPRIGESWRERWASLRLFTPRFMNTLPGMRFPEGVDPFPGKDEVADYEERYAHERGLALRTSTRVKRVRPSGPAFEITLDSDTLHVRSVVIATGAHQVARIPPFASRLDDRVRQLHSRDYGRAGRLPPGPVLIVGARNSGVEIALDLVRSREVTVAIGGPSRYAPARWRDPRWWRVAQLRNALFHSWFPPGPWPWPLRPPLGHWIEVDLARLERDGTLRTAPRVVGAEGDVVRFADGREMRPRTVIWATGFRHDDSWIEVRSGENGIAIGRHRRGPVPGLYILRANLLASLYWGGLAIVADIERQRR
jgi:putative flavoprotein involved in K+ transport